MEGLAGFSTGDRLRNVDGLLGCLSDTGMSTGVDVDAMAAQFVVAGTCNGVQ